MILRIVLAVAFGLALSQCIISRGVTPAAGVASLRHLCVVTNPAVHMDGLHPEIVSQLQGMGYSVSTVPVPPMDGTVYLEYTANWKWDIAMYLSYFEATLKQQGSTLGAARYNARIGGMNPGKFGRTAEKIRPLLLQLMGKAPLPYR
jgi:hypothetical protein